MRKTAAGTFKIAKCLELQRCYINAAIMMKEGFIVCLFFTFVFGEFAAPKVDIDGKFRFSKLQATVFLLPFVKWKQKSV